MAIDKGELAVAVGKGALGMIPVIGPLVAEIVGAVIPNQRLRRIESLLTALSSKITGFSEEDLQDRFSKPELVDLLEDGMFQTARALSEERIQYIASLIKNSLTVEETKIIQHKRLMALLGELNDFEIILLRSYAKHPSRDQEFWAKHEAILKPRSASMRSSWEELNEATIYEEYRNHLVRLGLLKNTYRLPSKGQLPEFDDKTGTMKASGREITSLGRLLLKRIDLIGDNEF